MQSEYTQPPADMQKDVTMAGCVLAQAFNKEEEGRSTSEDAAGEADEDMLQAASERQDLVGGASGDNTDLLCQGWALGQRCQ